MKKHLAWVGGSHDFAIDIAALRALETTCNAGPEELLRRVTAGMYRTDDVLHTIRLGLIGGGMSAPDAVRLVTSMAELHPIGMLRPTAQTLLICMILGDPDAPPVPEVEEAAG